MLVYCRGRAVAWGGNCQGILDSSKRGRSQRPFPAAYERFCIWKPEAEKDLLEAHRILMSGLVDGTVLAWRRGVIAGNQVIHMAPPADLAPHLIAALFRWLATTDTHPLIASPVFHYEFERLHRGQRPHGAAVAE